MRKLSRQMSVTLDGLHERTGPGLNDAAQSLMKTARPPTC